MVTQYGQHAKTPVAAVRIHLREGPVRSYDAAATKIVMGEVRFQGWQIFPLPFASPDHDAYLVKVNYDLDLAPDMAGPRWAEVGFAFPGGDVAVTDAIPHRVAAPQAPQTYTVTSQLNFIRQDGATRWPPEAFPMDIPMPGLMPMVDVFGIGGTDVRWRHTAVDRPGVRPGSHTGWLVLVVPPARRELDVVARAHYCPRLEDAFGLEPTDEPERFRVRLPAQQREAQADVPRARAATMAAARGSADPEPTSVSLGFAFDVVGYSARPVPAQGQVQQRLSTLTRLVVDKLGVSLDATKLQTAGDSVCVFLPAALDVAQALPKLLTSAAELLGEDNLVHTDRLRLRMAVTIGPIAPAALGYDGQTIIECQRLLDCDPLRELVRTRPQLDVGVLISDTVHSLFVRPRYADLDPRQFTRVLVVAKGYQQDAWLWTGPSGLRDTSRPGPP